jgi:hypothetical protein
MKTSRKPFSHAPLQGMGETYNWNIQNVQLVTFPAASSNAPYFTRIFADCNGYGWRVSTLGGAQISSSTPQNALPQQLYGESA